MPAPQVPATAAAMDLTIFALLAQDGITNGAIYALLALALVLVFAVTRVIWVPSGEFVAYGTLTLAGLQLGKPPGTVGLLSSAWRWSPALMEVVRLRSRRGERAPDAAAARRVDGHPAAIAGAAWWLARIELPFWAQILVTLALVTALGPLLYRIAYQPIAEASVLVLLIVSVAVHFALTRARPAGSSAPRARARRRSPPASFDRRRRHRQRAEPARRARPASR